MSGMNLTPGTIRLTADSVIGISGKKVRVFGVHFVNGGTANTLYLRNGTSTAGSIYIQVDGVANKGVTENFAGGLLLPAGCYVDFSATTDSPYAVIIFSNEP
jgi:hypothetical protein